MITGETEAIFANYYEDYDHFLFFGRKRKKNRTPLEKAKRKERRKQFWTRLGKNVEQGGGAEGIGKTVDNIIGIFGKNKEGAGEDYEIAVAQVPVADERKSGGIPASVWVVGGLIIMGVIAWKYTKSKDGQTRQSSVAK